MKHNCLCNRNKHNTKEKYKLPIELFLKIHQNLFEGLDLFSDAKLDIIFKVSICFSTEVNSLHYIDLMKT